MSKVRDEKWFDRQWDQWQRHVESERFKRNSWVPWDVIEARAMALWFENPHSLTDPIEQLIAEWPARRREILLELHSEVMESLARHGPLP